MNKKLVSFVLAMVLSVGLGVSSLFAYSYSKYATEFASYYSGSTSKGSVYLTILGSDSADKVLQGNLTAVFGYYAGSLLSYQAAGGQFQLYDSYGARFSCNNDGGIWTVTGVNLRSSDLNEIMKYDTMEDFLMSMGFTEESLAVTQMDEDGNILTTKTYDEDVVADEDINYEVGDTYLEDIKDKDGNVIHKKGDKVKEEDLKDGDETVNIVKYKKGTVLHKKGDQIAVKDLSEEQIKDGYTIAKTKISGELYSKLIETLASGVNFSASISIGSGVTGPSLTISENGKPQITYTSDPTTGGIRPTQLYVYDDKGFQIGIQTATFELDSTSNGAATGHWTCNYTSITYDKNGVRTDTAYQFYEWSSDPVDTIKNGNLLNDIPAEVRYAEGYYDSEGNMITQAEFEALSQDDKKKYSFKAGGTVNEDALKEYMKGKNLDGQISSVTHYSANNSALYSYDYTTNQTTYFANNKPSYVVNAEGTTVGLYSYSENGVMTAYFNANGTDNNGNKVGTTTIFDQWGRQLFTAVGGLNDGSNPFKDHNARAELMAEYEAAIADGKVDSAKFEYDAATGTYKAIEGTGTRITTISIYTDQLFNKNSESYSQFTTNGFLDMKKVQAALNGLNTSGANLIISAMPSLADGIADALGLDEESIKKMIEKKEIDLSKIEGLTAEQIKKIKENPLDSSKWGLSTELENKVLSAIVAKVYVNSKGESLIDFTDEMFNSVTTADMNGILNQLIKGDLSRIDLSGFDSLKDPAERKILSAVVHKLYGISSKDLEGLSDKNKLALLRELTQDAHSIVVYDVSNSNEFGFGSVGDANIILNKVVKKIYGIDINSFDNLSAKQKNILLNRILNNAYNINLTANSTGDYNYTLANNDNQSGNGVLTTNQQRRILRAVAVRVYGFSAGAAEGIGLDDLRIMANNVFDLTNQNLMNQIVQNLYKVDLSTYGLTAEEQATVAKGFLSVISVMGASYRIDITGTNSGNIATQTSGLYQSDAALVDKIMNTYLPAAEAALTLVYNKVMASVGDTDAASKLGEMYAGLARVAANASKEAAIAIDTATIRRDHADTGISKNKLNGYKASLETTVGTYEKTARGAVNALQSEFNWKSILNINSGSSLALLNCLNTNLFKLGYTVTDFANMLSFSNGGATAVASTTIAVSTWDGDNIPGMDGVDGSADYSDVDYHSVTRTNGRETSSTHGSHVQWSVKNKRTDSKVAAAGMTFTNTIMLGGAQAYSKQHNVVTDVYEVTDITVSTESDPVVEGTLFPEVSDEELEANGIDPNDKEAVAEYKQKKLETVAESLNIGHYDDEGNFVVDDEEAYENLQQGFYVKDGKTYAVVNAASINMMDGEGFQAAEGELVFVEIDEETKNSIIENGSKTIMFMGNVSASVGPDSSGQPYLTMVMDKSYSGGYKQGAEAVQNAKNEIFLTSIGAALNNGMSVEEVQAKIDAYNEANGTEFTAVQATERYESNKTEGTEYNWAVKNTNDNMTLFGGQSLSVREAWGLLFNGDANSYQKQQNKRIMAAARSNDFSLDVLF